MSTNPFADAPVIHSYTRQQAIEDGVLVDANLGDLDEVTRQHFKVPVAMTRPVFELIRKAVENPKWMNDYRGVWHDVCWMSRMHIVREFDATTHLFQVRITGTGRKRVHTFKAVCGPNDDASPCITIMMPDED